MKQLNEQQMVCQKIMFGGFTNAELEGVAEALRFARAQLTKATRRSLTTGDVVKFTSNRNGVTYQGTVEKVKLKYVLVSTPQGRYNVPANMLEAV